MVQALAQNAVLVSALERFWVNSTDVVWLDAGKLRAAPKDGSGTTRTIAEGVYGGELSALDDTQLVLDTRAAQGVLSVDLTSGAVRVWPLGLRANALALERGHLLVASAACGRLVRVSEGGGPDTNLVLCQRSSDRIAADPAPRSVAARRRTCRAYSRRGAAEIGVGDR